MPAVKYYPSISTLITEESLPANLGFIAAGLQPLFEHIFYKNLMAYRTPEGEAAQCSLKIISYKRLAFEIPGVEGLALVLFPGNTDGDVTEFAISVGIRWEVLRFMDVFEEGLPDNPGDWINLLLDILSVDPIDF